VSILKERILELLHTEQYKKLSVNELRTILKIESSEDLVVLMKTINELLDTYVIIENSYQELTLIEYTNYVVGTLDLKPRGFGFVIPDDPSKEDVFIAKNNVSDAMNKDRVLVHVENFSYGMRQEGIIKKVIERNNTHLIGTLHFRNGMGYLDCDDKSIQNDIVIKKENINHAVKFDVVRVKITNYSWKGRIEAVVTDILGKRTDSGVDVLSKILKFNIDPVFPDEVIEAASKFQTIGDRDLEGRTDLTKEKIITIDGDDSKDFDDAVIVKQLDNGNYHLGVHIADVSHYVTEDSILDQEAYKRGTSIYLCDRVVPMLPFNLSNGMCSLVPNEIRLTISCDMEIGKDGKVIDYKIYPSYIKSYARMTYNKVNEIFMGNIELSEEYVELVGMFYDMRNLAKILNKRRNKQGSINFETDEAYIILDDNGKAIDIKKRDRGISENIIEEFMLKANQVVAEHVAWMELPFIYRVHEQPKEEKLNRLLKMAAALGYPVRGKSEISHFELQKLLEEVHGTESEQGINLLMLRSMQKAIYSEMNLGHYGLSFKFYTHFTSPIRRYPDLIVHRLLREYLFRPSLDSKIVSKYQSVIKDIGIQTSKTERNAVLLEREVSDMKKAEYISRYINKRFDGVISSITPFGLYVTLPNTVEGLVHISALDDDYYHYAEELMILVGERKKRIYRIGDKVTIQVMKTNIPDGEVDFRIVR
jgi:ribonuclease R